MLHQNRPTHFAIGPPQQRPVLVGRANGLVETLDDGWNRAWCDAIAAVQKYNALGAALFRASSEIAGER